MAILGDAIKRSLAKVVADEDDEDLSTGDLSTLIDIYDRLLRRIEENAKTIHEYYSPQKDINADFDILHLFKMIGKFHEA